mmetsp:Transcript_11206/g.34457  ORF Transcript_11206/g.34457 Transcript_11206/m.34457 type:complete len:499 (+) Transcript_11206:160-1656(+)
MGCSASSKVETHDDVANRELVVEPPEEKEEEKTEEVAAPARRRSSFADMKNAVIAACTGKSGKSREGGGTSLFLPWLGLAGLVAADKSWSVFKGGRWVVMSAIPHVWASKYDILKTIWAYTSGFVLGFLSYLFAFLRHFLAPLVVILGGLWINRKFLIKKVVEFLKGKGILLKELSIDADVDLKKKAISSQIRDIGLALEKDEDSKSKTANINIAEVDAIDVGFSVADGADVLIDGVRILFVAYDMKFQDTNINRLIEKLGGKPDENAEKPPPPPKKEEPKKDTGEAAPVPKFKARIKSGCIEVKAKGPLGTRSIIPPIKLDDEQLSQEVLSSKIALLGWVNGVVLRTIANSGFDAIAGGFDAVGGAALGGVDAVFGGVNKVADKVPGGFLVKGATGATSSVLHGTVGGAGKIVGGVAGGGKAVVKGVTSGSVSGLKDGLKEAGGEVAGGVKGGVGSAAGGVAGAGGAARRSSMKSVKEESTKDVAKEASTKDVAAAK